MASIGIYQNSILNSSLYNNPTKKLSAESTETAQTSTVKNLNSQTNLMQNPIKASNNVAFKAAQTQTVRTELTTKEEKEKYSALLNSLDKKERKNLERLLKNGTLLNADSNDKSSTLDNLYKIISTQRAPGLNPKVVLKETLNTLANPFIITQRFGDTPKEYAKEILSKPHDSKVNEKSINVERSGCCVAASIEFTLASQMPSEFARFAEELTSPKVSVEKTIQLDNLANNTLDAVWLLNAFEVPYKMDDFNKAKLTLAPDKNALIRAQIQNSNKDRLERSLVDVLMQSTFMNVGSQQTYNSLTDIRQGKFNQNDKGLIEFEKTFTESVVEDKNKISVTYQIVDENAKLTGYETDFQTVKKHLLESLAMGESVIIGYTQTDDKNTIINGHEITIIGAKQGKDGKITFICNDTDDNNPRPIEYPEDYIIPKIHHAGLPQKVAEKDVKFVDNWVEGLNAYKDAKKEAQNNTQPNKATV